MIRQADRLATGLLALLLLGAPLPWGSVTPPATAAVEVGAFLAFALALFGVEGAAPLRRVRGPALALAGLAVLGLVQALPWPASWVHWLSPEHARRYASAAELSGSSSNAMSLSLAPAATLSASLLFAAAAAAFCAAALASGDRRQRRVLAAALIGSATIQIFLGTRGWFARSTEIWGRVVPGHTDRLRGTFVNPDHLAFLVGLALPAVWAWAWWSFRRAREETQVDRRVLRVVAPVVVWLTLFLGMAFTGSRAGLLAALAAAVAQGALVAFRDRKRIWAFAGAAAATVGLLVVWIVARQEGLGRFSAAARGGGLASRFEAWSATIDLWLRFPIFGSGLGTFREAFSLTQPPTLGGAWRHAHSDPLELLSTTGVVGFVVLAVGVLALVRTLWRGLDRGLRSEDRAAVIAAFGALVAGGLHEGLDFGLTVPANGFAAAVLFGAAAGARFARSREPRSSSSGTDSDVEKAERARHHLAADGNDFDEVQARRERRAKREDSSRLSGEDSQHRAVDP